MSEQLHTITQNWISLMKVKEIRQLARYLIEKGEFTEQEFVRAFSSEDERHNKRMFFFALQEKHNSALVALQQWLIAKGHQHLAGFISQKKSGCAPFRAPQEENEDEEEEENEISSSIEADQDMAHVDNNTTPLNIDVKLATEFYDSSLHNPNIQFYSSRSKKRGRVLIINNYEFWASGHTYRKGANVDEENLFKMFTQMGGWVIERHKNKTTEQMRLILKDFARYEKDKICDICFVFVMSHGSENVNKTTIYGIDGNFLYTTDVQEYFIPSKCRLFRGKPKIFIYQVCRGSEHDLAVHNTEVDSIFSLPSTSSAGTTPTSVIESFRSIEDMLIGYATLHGSKAHRDTFRGTWYIELICQNFMNLANHESVDHLLMKVDEGLRRRTSEFRTMQTSETENKGFKKLYLNPGIYEENGVLKNY